MAGFKQPYLFIKFFSELVENGTESFEMLKVPLESRQWEESKYMNSLASSKLWQLLKTLNTGDVSFSKRDENMDWVKWLVVRNRRITVHEVANMLGSSSGAIQSILKDSLNMCQIAGKFVPYLLWLCVWISAWKQYDCNSILSLVTRFSAVLLPSMSELEMTLGGRRFNDFIMIEAKSWVNRKRYSLIFKQYTSQNVSNNRMIAGITV